MKTVGNVINVWIHGTLPTAMLPEKLAALSLDGVQHFFYCKPGLHKALDHQSFFHHHLIARAVADEDQQNFPLESFYLFGWSGKLSRTHRKKAAHKLYHDLITITEQYKSEHGCMPVIRLITHSHGGNVALNLARIHEEAESSLMIEELVLLACPVQQETAQAIGHARFKSIYSVHSHSDMVQVLDPQGLVRIWKHIRPLFAKASFQMVKKIFSQMSGQPFFSQRHFEHHEKLIQVPVKFGSRNLLHLEFMLLPFARQLPKLMERLREIKREQGAAITEFKEFHIQL